MSALFNMLRNSLSSGREVETEDAVEALRPNIDLYSIRRESKLDVISRLASKFLKDDVKAKNLKQIPSLDTLSKVNLKLDRDGILAHPMFAVYYNTLLAAYPFAEEVMEELRKQAEVTHPYVDVCDAVTNDRTRGSFTSSLLEIIIRTVRYYPDLLENNKASKPDLDLVNICLMWCELVYVVSKSSVIALLAVKIMGLDSHIGRVFDYAGETGARRIAVDLNRLWFFNGSAYELPDTFRPALDIVYHTTRDLTLSESAMEAYYRQQQHIFTMAIADGPNERDISPLMAVMGEGIQNPQAFADTIFDMQARFGANKIDAFIEFQKHRVVGAFTKTINPIIQTVGDRLKQALHVRAPIELKTIRTEIAEIVESSCTKSRTVLLDFLEAQENSDFAKVAEYASVLETYKTEFAANLNAVLSNIDSRIESVTPSVVEHVNQVQPTPVVDKDSEEMQNLLLEEIDVLKERLQSAADRELELKQKLTQSLAQIESLAVTETTSHCFTEAALRFMSGEGRVADVIEVINLMRPDIVFCPGIAHDLESSLYNKPEKLLKGLMLLAEYHKAIVSGKCDAQAMDILGNNYSANESESVMSNTELRAMRQFKLPNGERVEMQQHLTIGTRNGEAYTIQVHFRIIDNVLYIGRIGGHLPNSSKY